MSDKNNRTDNKNNRFIEDSKEVREAIADLESKANSYDDGYQEGDYASDEEYYDSDAEYYDSQEYDEYGPEDYDVDNYADDYEEDIAGDTFEEVIDQTVNIKGTIADAYSQQQEYRKAKREKFSKKRDPEEQEMRKADKKAEKKKKKNKGKKDDDIIISLENVSKSYVKGIPALNNVNINIKKGEFVFIVGGSGSGKSTLIKLLLRELQPTSGSIMVNGFQVEKLSRWKIPKLRRSMGVVFQDFRLLMDRNVYENVAFAQRIIQTPAREMKKNVPNMLSMVGLAGMYKKKPNELSGGEQQRVALARALVNKPEILLCDEPTGNLDPAMTTEIMKLLERINEKGTTVVVVTHNDKVVDDMQKRVITIRKGVIVSDEKKGGYSND